MDYHLSAMADFFSGITLSSPVDGAWIALALGLLLLLVSAFVSGSEIAFFSLSPADMNELEERRTATDRRVLLLLKDSERLLATILCSNNMVNVAIIMLLNYFFLSGDKPVVDFGGNSVLEFLTMTVVLTFLLLLFGEIMPKIASAQNPLRMVRFCAPAYSLLIKLWWPISSLLMQSTKLTSRLEMTPQQLSVGDLEQALKLTDKEEIADEQQMLKGIIRFGGEMAREVMTPRVDIVGLDIKTPFPDVIKCIVENNYSRIPVYSDSEDNIKGILYIKDLLPHLGKPSNFRWQTLVRQATFVPETKMIDDLLRDFQAQKVHIAIVVDEFGGTSGLVTMEDIIEEIVGEINDEYDDDERPYTRLNQNTYVFEAKTLLSDFRKIMQLPKNALDEVAPDADTLAGLLLEIKGEFPKEHERIQYGRFTFEVMEMDERRIVKIKVIIGKEKTEE